MNDYERIAALIRYVDEHRRQQPSLDELAAQAGLSASHLHRLFSKWAAITPKDFLQTLTLEHAKQRLRQGETVLAASLAPGLSGPGRLHDLCVSLEAASPGEIKTGGQGWTLLAGVADTPFGRCCLANGPRGVCHLSFIEPDAESLAWEALQRDWPRAIVRRDDKIALEMARKIFSHSPSSAISIKAYVHGTPFQVRVWRALLRIPPGGLTSYGRLAKTLGQPTAARAVGSAVGSNPVSFLIPCHRVIRETGVIGDYHWGAVRKRAMITWERRCSTDFRE
jgi:AraC family transcriptional regulator of adaptative response/methylated-DNA-[protein]-cysteine methyltransferase